MQNKNLIIIFITLLVLFSQTFVYSWPIPHSGQTKCYDNEKEIPCPKPGEPFYGQSGNYIINPRSYTKLDEQGNELPDDAEEWFMVRDNVTGLVWEVKQANDGSQDYSNPHDSDNEYTWYDSNSETNFGYTGTYNDGRNTEQLIQQINGSNFGGFEDWRLPSIKELSTLINLGFSSFSYDKNFFRLPLNQFNYLSSDFEYWSSTSVTGKNDLSWLINFAIGVDHKRLKSSERFVRAVRKSNNRPFDHLVKNPDNTITDIKTGLMWQSDISNKLNWKEALQYCQTLTLADYTDWRLPERNEIRSIANYAEIHFRVDNSFKNRLCAFYWTSTSMSATNAYGFYFNSYMYGYAGSKLTDIYYARAVRGGQNYIVNQVYIWKPKQASILCTGNSFKIKWEPAGINSKIKISLSRHGGKNDTFESIISETENDGLFDWTISGPPSPNCMLRIVPISFPYSGTQQSFFTIKNSDILVHTNVHSSFSISGPDSYTGTGTSWTKNNSSPGDYTITYDPLTCWKTPAQESQSLTYWNTISFSGIYNGIPSDSIQNLRADRDIKTWTGNNQISLQWKPIDQCLKGYAFAWDYQNNTEPPDVITGIKPYTVSPPLENRGDHWFHIKSINIHGNVSETVHIGPFYIDTSLLPKRPENLLLEQNTIQGIQLKWIPIDSVSSYTVYRSQNEQGLFYPIHSEPVNYYDAIVNGFWDIGIEPDQTYFYKIKSYLAGQESLNFSNTVHVKTPDDHPTFDVQFLSNKHQIVPAGSKATYSMVLNKTDAFQGALDIWCENLPEYVRYELSVNHQPSGTRANIIHQLPATLNLSIITGSATSIGNHQFDLQCLNSDGATGYKQKTWKLDLTVVPLTGGIFVDVEPYHIHKNDPVAVSGRIYLFKENQSIQLEAWNNDQKYAATLVTTQAGGWFEDHEWLQGFAPGIYTIKAIWEDTLPFSDETRSLIIEKTRPQLFLSSQENQVAEIDKDFTIKVEVQPAYAYETIKLRLFKPEDSQPDTFDLSTDENGQVQLSRIFFQEKGKHTFKAYFMGNDSSIGCESNAYPVMVGNTGFAILVGGGIATTQNLEWNVTKKLLTDAYLDFKRMGFSDDMIYLMIDSEIMDINGDDIKDDIVDEDDPSVNKLIDVIKTEFSDVLTENDTLYLYMMGHGTNNAKFRLYGTDEYISSAQLNTALNDLQEQTSCSVVIILEYCYSGTFIQALHHPKRLIITSADNEPYRTDDSGNISLSRYLFSRLCRGYSIQKAFEYARNKLTNIGYPSPRLDDFDNDHLLADLTYLPEQLKWTQPEISHIDLYPILDGKNTLSVSVSVESAAESITKVWAQVIPPAVNISSGTGTIQFHETQLNHVQGTEYSGEVEGFSYDGNYNVIFYAKNRSSEVSEPVQWIVRAMNIGRKKDFNQDGFINLEDMIIVLRSLSGVNVSEKNDLADAVHLMQYLGK
jgi:hypothetical protein